MNICEHGKDYEVETCPYCDFENEPPEANPNGGNWY